MSSLLDEIAADSGNNNVCKVCGYLRTLSPDDRLEWVSVLKNDSLSSAAIARALVRRGLFEGDTTLRPGASSVTNHRERGHIA